MKRLGRIRAIVVGGAMLASLAYPAAAAVAADAQALGDIREQITDINQDVEKKKRDLTELQSRSDQYKKLILEKKMESASLEDEIALLENGIAKNQLSIEIAKKEIQGLELEIHSFDEQIAGHAKQIGKERILLGTLARKLYRAKFKKSTFEILLSHPTLSEYFDSLQSIADLQTGVRKSLTKLDALNASLDEERKGREARKLGVADRKRELDAAKMGLEDNRSLKQTLLIETKSSELEFRYLLADLQREQNEADSEIDYLERVLREKLDIADRLAAEETVLSWPVVPARGLSATFHDPEYPFRAVFEHPAIDIRAAQGTPVRAAAAGIVARAKNAGYGYSYVMLLHNNGVSTVYGHLSKITAKEDTFVERGEIIGYSGGMPGTPGAGRLTTGPHLHFETRVKGIPEDPMKYLVAF